MTTSSANPIAGNWVKLLFPLTDSGAILPLSGASVICKIVDPSTPPSHLSLPATIVNASTGLVSVTLTPTQMAVAGVYHCSCQVTFGDGTTVETEPSVFVVESPLF